MTIDKKNFDAACRDLGRHVERIALAALIDAGFDGYKATSSAPNLTAEVPIGALSGEVCAWLQAPKGARLFHVFDGGCETAIYSARVNHLFRAWHDITHLQVWKGFDTTSENLVAMEQAKALPEGLLRDIFLADTVGQTAFAGVKGGFVVDQRQFVFDVLNVGVAEACNRAAALRESIAIAGALREAQSVYDREGDAAQRDSSVAFPLARRGHYLPNQHRNEPCAMMSD